VARPRHGQYYKPVVEADMISIFYRGLDGVMRQTLIKLSPNPTAIDERTAR